MHIGQIDDDRRFVDERHRQVAVQAERTRPLQANRLHPVGGLRVEYVQMRFGEDQQMAITVGWRTRYE